MIAVVEERQGPRGEGSCAWPGCSAPWEQVDHIFARAEYPELADEPDNWQGLCADHNRAKGAGAMPARPAGGSTSRAWL
jgi:5-methylcytosine-specific restriction endonuclease McrA